MYFPFFPSRPKEDPPHGHPKARRGRPSSHSSDSDAGRYERGVRATTEDAEAVGGGFASPRVRRPLRETARALAPWLSHDGERLRCRHARHEQGLRARVLRGGRGRGGRRGGRDRGAAQDPQGQPIRLRRPDPLAQRGEARAREDRAGQDRAGLPDGVPQQRAPQQQDPGHRHRRGLRQADVPGERDHDVDHQRRAGRGR